MRPMGTAAYGGKGQGKGKGRGEGRLGHGGRGRSKGGEKPMGTTAYGGKGSKGRAANGDRPVGAASCRREQQIQGVMPTPPPPPNQHKPVKERKTTGLFEKVAASTHPKGHIATVSSTNHRSTGFPRGTPVVCPGPHLTTISTSATVLRSDSRRITVALALCFQAPKTTDCMCRTALVASSPLH